MSARELAPHPFLPNLDERIMKEMLERVGAKDVSELFSDVPAEFMLKRPLAIPEGEPEASVRRNVTARLATDVAGPNTLCFLGGGVWPHYIPAAVDSVLSRQEFYTSYTPYQPEISQGMLQAMFEYQSLMCDLLGMQVCNSSLYDWAAAAAEAVRMVCRLRSRKVFLVAGNVGPERLQVIRTYVQAMDLTIRTVGIDDRTGRLDLGSLRERVNDEVAGLYLENPNYLGVVESEIESVVDMVHRSGGLCVVGVDPISLSLLREPGSYGADIVVGDGQPLGIPMNYGGPHLGIFAVKDMVLARSMPGRIIGMTTTRDGKERAFCMVLQTREQHIRRESATSSITTNQALLALAAACYLALLGRTGFARLGQVILRNSHYAAERIREEVQGVESPALDSDFFKEFVVRYSGIRAETVYSRLAAKGIMGSFPLVRHFPALGEVGGFCVTEVHTAGDVSELVSALKGVV